MDVAMASDTINHIYLILFSRVVVVVSLMSLVVDVTRSFVFGIEV
jgi:hypothetical protein